MNKLILCLIVLFSSSLFAQEEDTVPELNAAGEEIVPEKSALPVSTETVNAISETPTHAVTGEGPPASAVTEDSVLGTLDKTTPEVHEEPVAEVNEEPTPVVTEDPKPKTKVESGLTPALVTDIDMYEQRKFNPRASHWVTTFTFEGSKYENIPEGYEFEGRKDFKQGEKALYGGRLGFGGEIYLGAGFVTRSLVEGYYLGTLFSRILNGGSEAEDVEFAYTKQTGQVTGVDASQSFGWMFDFKTRNPLLDEWTYLAVELYVDAAIGKAYAYNRTNYSYDTGTAPTAAQESFKLRVRDDLLNARVGAGVNFTSNSGFFLALKATVNRYEITKRKIDGYTQENGQVSTPINDEPKDASIDPVVIYTIGGGYKF